MSLPALLGSLLLVALLVSLLASPAWAQPRLVLHLRNGTSICHIPTWTREGTDLRVEIADGGSTFVLPPDSIAAAWLLSKVSDAQRRETATRWAVVAGLAPIVVAMVVPAGEYSKDGSSLQGLQVLLGVAVAPFTALVGFFLGDQFAAGGGTRWSRDQTLIPLGPADEERSALSRAEAACR
ncbi:MAG: hypothetical protein SFW08_00785 [Gemmatimonadaceae bacterium]|nr:hypothetical protein [Gemmatimonadaceae bacterium]